MESATESFNGLLGGLFLGLSYADFAIPIGFVLWSMLLFFKMKQVDCSHFISGTVYICYCMFCGVILVIVIPEQWTTELSFSAYFKWIIIFAFISSLKWVREWIKQRKGLEFLKSKRKEKL